MITEQLNIIKDDSVSIDDLVALQESGVSVLRSAHVGNLSPYNLTIANAGLPILSVDHTITGVDRNYVPETIGTRDARDQVAPFGKLVCRATVDGDAAYLDEYHVQAVRDAIPRANIFTNTEYLVANEAVVGEIVTLARAEFADCFERVAMPDGSVTRQASAADMVGQYGIMQLSDEPRADRRAVIMPNVVNILANFVVETLATEQPVQYHLSGPDMVRYIDRMVPDLRRMYGRLVETASYGGALPAELEVRLVPTAQAKFATTTARRLALDALYEAFDAARAETVEIAERRRAFFTSTETPNGAVKTAFVNATKQQEKAAMDAVLESAAAIPELFASTGQPGAITQYDVLAEGGMYVPDFNRQQSMAQLGVMSGKLKDIVKRQEL